MEENRLHKYLDRIIQSTIEYDFPHTLDEIELDHFDHINIEIFKDAYFDKDLVCIAIFGVDGFDYENHFHTIVIRKKDIKSEFNNDIQKVIEYIHKPLDDYNNKLIEEIDKYN